MNNLATTHCCVAIVPTVDQLLIPLSFEKTRVTQMALYFEWLLQIQLEWKLKHPLPLYLFFKKVI